MQVLCIHDVVDGPPVSPWEVDSADLDGLIRSAIASGYRFRGLDADLGVGDRDLVITVDDGARGAFEWLESRPDSWGLRATLFVVVDWLDSPPLRAPTHDYRALAGWSDVLKAEAAGHSIGSHTMSHRPLHTLEPGPLRHELGQSRERLAATCAGPIEHVAAPFGKLSPPVLTAATAAGFRTMSSTRPGVNTAEDLAAGVLKRWVVRSDRPGLDVGGLLQDED